jgi:ribosomal-protein-alanine N-acetyltransferase
VSATLETDRLRLSPIAAEDLDAVAALYADPDVMRFIGLRAPLTREQTRERLDFMIGQWREHGFGMWAVLRKADGAFVGRCGLRTLDDTTEIELGYTLAKAYWGQGYATEAARAVVRHAFDVLKLERLVAIADPANAASINVMKKLGMTFEGTGHFYNSDCVMYALAPGQGSCYPSRS